LNLLVELKATAQKNRKTLMYCVEKNLKRGK